MLSCGDCGELVERVSRVAFAYALLLIMIYLLQAELLSDWPGSQQLQHLSEHSVHHIQVPAKQWPALQSRMPQVRRTH